LGDISPTQLSHVLQLDLDFEKICEEGEKRGEGERHGEESNETHLDHSFIVEAYKIVSCWFHAKLLFNFAVDLQISKFHLILRQFGLLNRFFKFSLNFLDFVSYFNLVLVVLHDVKNDLLEDHDGEDVD